jgi:hypothetical protein
MINRRFRTPIDLEFWRGFICAVLVEILLIIIAALLWHGITKL